MIDLNELEAAINRCAFDGDVLGLSKAECRDLLNRIRQAEKDAARYRWLRDVAGDSDVCEALFNAGYDEFDSFIDEAMQCK